MNATIVSAKYSAGPKRSADRRQRRREEGQRNRRERSGHERSDGGRRQRRRAAALPRHHVAVDGRGNRCRFARRVEQDAGGRSAVHRAVVDPAEHDERADRVEGERDRQQHRDGQRRADAWQHADGRAERDARERPAEVGKREGVAEAVASAWSVSSTSDHDAMADAQTVPRTTSASVAQIHVQHRDGKRELEDASRTADKRQRHAIANTASRTG